VSKEQPLTTEGVVTEVLPNTMFRVALPNGQRVPTSAEMRKISFDRSGDNVEGDLALRFKEGANHFVSPAALLFRTAAERFVKCFGK
jgi:translation initiation factor IF-1